VPVLPDYPRDTPPSGLKLIPRGTVPRSVPALEVRFDSPETCGCKTCSSGGCCNAEDFRDGDPIPGEPGWCYVEGLRVVRRGVEPGTAIASSWAPQSLGQIEKSFRWVGTRVRRAEDFARLISTGRLSFPLRRRRTHRGSHQPMQGTAHVRTA